MARPVTRRRIAADSLPQWVRPQLTQLVDAAPEGDQWLHEIKYEGYRMHARLDRGAVKLKTRCRATVANSSRDGYPAVDRQNLARDHARFVTGEIKRHVSDIVRLDQAEQMRVGKRRQRGVSGDELFDPIGHRRRWRNCIEADSLRRIGDSQLPGDSRDPTLCRSIAIAAGDTH